MGRVYLNVTFGALFTLQHCIFNEYEVCSLDPVSPSIIIIELNTKNVFNFNLNLDNRYRTICFDIETLIV